MNAMNLRRTGYLVCASALFLPLALSFALPALAADDAGKHLFILSGQSNMAGLKPEESFTPAVVKAFGKEGVIVVHDAQGGQPIRRWDLGWKNDDDQQSPQGDRRAAQPPGDLYQRLLNKVRKAIDGKSLASVTFLWMQGERDAREANGDRYAASLGRLVEQVRRDLNQKSIHVVIGRLSDFDMENRRYPHWTKIREIQVEFAKKNPGVAWVDTDDLNDGINRQGKRIKNDLHYSADGYVTFGSRLAEKAIAMINVDSGAASDRAPSSDPAKTGSTDVTEPSQPDRKIEYKKIDDVSLQLHLFEPVGHQKSDRRPVIVFFFGGGWVGGSPSQFYRQSRYLANRGMVAICAEYRVRSRNQTTPRECVMDGKSAMRYVRSHAAELGIDPQRIVAAGGSAGGHVAAATATLPTFDEATDPLDVSPRPNALVLFNPVYDNSEKGYGHERVRDYWKQISPLHNLSPSTPPTIVFLGTNDGLIPVETAQAFQARMKDLGCRSELVLYEGQPHGFFNSGESFLDTLEKTDRFLISLDFLSGEPNVRQLLSGDQ